MFELFDFSQFLGVTIIIATILGIWDLIWKGIGMWHSARDSRKGWFVAILLFNTLGILPIIYIYLIRKKKKR